MFVVQPNAEVTGARRRAALAVAGPVDRPVRLHCQGSERCWRWLGLTGEGTQPLRELKVAELIGLKGKLQ